MSEAGAAPTAAPTAAPAAPTTPSAPAAVQVAPPATQKAANDNAAQAAQAPAPAAPEVHEVKIDGQVRKVKAADVRRVLGMQADEPIGPRELRALSAELSSRQRFDQAAQARKDVEAWRELAAKDPMAALVQSFGGDEVKAEAALMDYLARRLDERSMSPEERRGRELEEREKRLQEWERQQQQAAEAQRVSEIQASATRIFSQHLKAAGLPVTTQTLGRMAGVVEGYMHAGIDPNSVPAGEIVARVRAELEAEAAAYMQALPPDALAKLLGTRRDELRAQDAAELQTKLGERPRRPDGTFAPKPPPEPQQQISTRKMMQQIRERMGVKR